MGLIFHKYHGAGNDFVLIDNRSLHFPADNISYIAWLCDRRFGIGSDGLMLLQDHPGMDFEMRYFNADGKEASMCGNGGRCIVAYARRMGIIRENTVFMAVDGPHDALVMPDGDINLKMADVRDVEINGDEFCLDTGSPHFVRFLDSLDGLDVEKEGRAVRYSDRFREKGINVNFVEQKGPRLKVYTYERGVEAETLACGTGITASALSAALRSGIDRGTFNIKAKGGELSVSFERKENGFGQIWLKGPAVHVFEGVIPD